MAREDKLLFTIPADLKMWLQDYGNDYGLSMASVIRMALYQFKRQESRIRETVIAYQETQE